MGSLFSIRITSINKSRHKLDAKDVFPNINRKQAAERAENAVFVTGDLDL